eukprot:601400-Pyramimonas_sp.AAC.1
MECRCMRNLTRGGEAMPPKGSKKATKKDKNAAQGGARTDEEKVARKANSEHENALNRLRQAMK